MATWLWESPYSVSHTNLVWPLIALTYKALGKCKIVPKHENAEIIEKQGRDVKECSWWWWLWRNYSEGRVVRGKQYQNKHLLLFVVEFNNIPRIKCLGVKKMIEKHPFPILYVSARCLFVCGNERSISNYKEKLLKCYYKLFTPFFLY